jgi:hypothetical protein
MELENDLTKSLNDRLAVAIAFPPCSDELLALINTTKPVAKKDDVTLDFEDYFKFRRHKILIESTETGGKLSEHLDAELLGCLGAGQQRVVTWPTECCFCPSCVTLDGHRNPSRPADPKAKLPPPQTVVPTIRRLFIGDLVWLFAFEQMGVFRILGVLLDEFATRGNIAVSNGAPNPPDVGIKDDIMALVLEAMVRQTKMGLSSGVRDRDSSYRRCLGWTSESGRNLGSDALVNSRFPTLFTSLIRSALEFFKDKRMAVAIRGAVTPAPPPSRATLVTISQTIANLRNEFERFDYGRNYFNTLNGIVWAISAMAIIRDLREALGIPPLFNEPHEYFPAAYERLVTPNTKRSAPFNRYSVYRDFARNARDLLLDVEVVGHDDVKPGGQLERWLELREDKFEEVRTAVLAMTRLDLGEPRTKLPFGVDRGEEAAVA